MSRPVLSVLDPAPIFTGQSASRALEASRALAAGCADLGYHRYWVQEHHNTPCFASVAPAVLIADLAARTPGLRFGAGGVMLPNYSPLKVAEQFASLSALYPGRIDLGIGRATGADPRTSAALLGPGAQSFPTMFQLLKDWLLDASGEAPIQADHRAYGIHARPSAPKPDLWMLCSSAESAAFAGAVGAKMAFADFLAPGGAAEAISAYRQQFTPSAFADAPYAGLALVALAAATEADAFELSAPSAAWSLARAQGRFARFPMPDEAQVQLADAGPAATQAARERAIVGDRATVAARLKAMAHQTEADELFLLTIAHDPSARLESYRLIAKAMSTA